MMTSVETPRRRRRATLKDASRAWRDHPDLVQKFVTCVPEYERLCSEVSYIVRRRLEERDIKVAAITSRAKTLESFLDKLTRKYYSDPFTEVTDFAGVRVVCLYKSDLTKIEEIISDEFVVLERLDKESELEADEFGYLAVHFIVGLGDKSSGARYDDLRTLKCEIQVRTVLQDAWAIIQHHLEYKKEAEIPTPLRRKIHSLAAVFEMSDERFDDIREERESYLEEVREASSLKTKQFSQEVNLDTLKAYLVSKVPDLPYESRDGGLAFSLKALGIAKYTTIGQIDAAFAKQHKFVQELRAELPDFLEGADELVDIVLYVTDDEFRNAATWIEKWRASDSLFDQLLKARNL